MITFRIFKQERRVTIMSDGPIPTLYGWEVDLGRGVIGARGFTSKVEAGWSIITMVAAIRDSEFSIEDTT